MKVWYRLPDIDGNYENDLSLKPGNQAQSLLFRYFVDDLDQFLPWFKEQEITNAKLEFKWERDIMRYTTRVAVGFEMDEQQALLFRLKFGNGYIVS